MRLVFIVLLLPVCSLAQAQAAGKVNSQTSTGNCSPNIVSSGSGSVTVQMRSSCGNVDPRVLTKLTESLQQFLAQNPKTITNLNELLELKDVQLEEKGKEVEEWIGKYNELSQQLKERPADDELSKQAADALHQGDLQRAEQLLNDLLTKEEKQVDLTAQN